MTLTTHHLAFTATALTPVALGEQSGSAVRGAVAGALWERFCTNRAATACEQCPLVSVCPVAALLAPMRDEGQKGGEQRPRPYVVRPPQDAGRTYQPGEPIGFGLALFGSAAALFPYVVMAARELERGGLGMRLPQLGGRRGTLRLTAISAIDPSPASASPSTRLTRARSGSRASPSTPRRASASPPACWSGWSRPRRTRASASPCATSSSARRGTSPPSCGAIGRATGPS